MKSTRPQIGQFVESNPVEALRDMGSDIMRSVAQDVIKSGFDDVLDEVFGSNEKKGSGEMKAGQEITFGKNEAEKPKPHIETAIDYHKDILHFEKRSQAEVSRETEVKIHEIIIELQRLVKEFAVLENKFTEVTGEQHIEKPGVYHLNFFKSIISLVRAARIQVEETSAWITAVGSKNARKNYWREAKTHGTSFTLSNERNGGVNQVA